MGYAILAVFAVAFVMFIGVGVPLFLNFPFWGGVTGASIGFVMVIYAMIRLTFILPDIALNRPTSISRAWGEMKGAVGILFWKMLLAYLLFGLLVFIPILLVNMIAGMIMPSGAHQMGIVGEGMAHLFVVWASILLYALLYRIMSNLYRYKVSSRI